MWGQATTRTMRIAVVVFLTAITCLAQIEFKKPKPAKPLPNPSIIDTPRDEVISVIKQMLETREIPVDKEDCSAISGECTLLTKPVVFIKGIATKSQLEHYCEMPRVDVRSWMRVRHSLRFQIAPATPRTSQVGVYAKFDGMMNSVSGSEWISLTSKGELEDLMLRCIQDRVRGGDCKDIFR